MPPSNALVHKPRSPGSQSSRNTPVDLLLPDLPNDADGTVARRGQLGLSVQQFTQAGGKVAEILVRPFLQSVWGPGPCRSAIKDFFGENDKRQAALDALHTVLQHTSQDCLSRQPKDLAKACHEMLKWARPSNTIDTQLLTFKILVTTIPRYPGLRRLLRDHRDVRNKSEEDLNSLWIRGERTVESCGEEWAFYRTMAVFSMAENALTKVVEATKPSELALVHIKGAIPIQDLLGSCKFAGVGFEPHRLCAIRYVAGILELPSFWDKRGSQEDGFFDILDNVCNTMFILLEDTEVKVGDPTVDISPSMSAARNAVDILCTATFKGLLRLHSTKRLPRKCPVALPGIISLLGGNGVDAWFRSASQMAPAVRELFGQSPTSPGRDNETHPNPNVAAIHKDARQGTLVGDTLTRYLLNNPNILGEQDPATGRAPLATAAVAGFADEVEQLLEKGAKADALSRDDETALLLTTREVRNSDQPRIVQLLLSRMPAGSVDATTAADGNNTALMYAVLSGNVESVRLLVEAGASLTATNDSGLTAKKMAAASSDKAVARELSPEKEGLFARLLRAASQLGWLAVESEFEA